MKTILYLIILISVPTIIYAQGAPTFPAVPVDGGLSILLGAGIAFGAKKVYDKHKIDKENE